jgi:hypothetical protein
VFVSAAAAALHTHADGVADDLHDVDRGVVAEHDPLARASGDDEHGQFLLGT